MVISEADGTVTEETLAYDAVVDPAREGLPPFMVDGQSVTDPAAIWTAKRIELTLLDGQSLVIERSGNTFTRIAPQFPDEAGIPTVAHFSDDLTTIELESAAGNSAIEIAGIEDQNVRAQATSLLALRMLGAQAGLQGELETEHLEPVTTIALVALGVAVIGGYVTCVTAGTNACASHADKMCPGGSTGFQFQTICGAGFDLNGRFQLGYHCSFRCN